MDLNVKNRNFALYGHCPLNVLRLGGSHKFNSKKTNNNTIKMEVEGKIILDLPLQEGISKAGNPWRKKEWVLETFGQYPRKVYFSVFGDRIDSFNLQVGNSYAISFDLESREFNGRWYTDVRAYASRPLEAQAPGAPQGMPPYGAPVQAPGYAGGYPAPAPAPGYPSAAPQSQQGFTAPEGNESDDLPF